MSTQCTRKTYLTSGNNFLTPRNMVSFMVCWFLLAKSNTNSESLFMLLLSAVLSYYLSSLYKHLFYFQARVEQSVLFHHLSAFSSYYGARPKTSHTRLPGDSRINAPSWVFRKHTSRLYPRHKQDQPISLLSQVSRSPSKLGLQAPTPKYRTQCGARTSIISASN